MKIYNPPSARTIWLRGRPPLGKREILLPPFSKGRREGLNYYSLRREIENVILITDL
jgi:hypothetical protein